MQENPSVTGTPYRTLLGVLIDPLVGVEGVAAPPKEPTPAYGPSGLASSVFLLSASPVGSGRRRLWATADRIFYAGSDLPAQ